MNVENASPQDAREIVQLIRTGFDPAVLETMIYGCDGMHLFVEHNLRLGELAAYRYTIARDADRVLAAAEFRLHGDTLFLNYIAVHPDGQGGGLGRLVLRRAVAEARAAGLKRFALDVFTFNAKAAGWYERMGMATELERTVWTGPLPPPSRAPRFSVPDFAQAEAVHARFGFSELSVERGGEGCRVGRMGARYFRLVGRALAADEELHACLARLAPQRELLAIVEGAPPPAVPWKPLLVSRRMSAPLDELRP